MGHNDRVDQSSSSTIEEPTGRANERRSLRERTQMPRPVLALVTLGALCVMVLSSVVLPVPYVIESPGPAIDVLGDYDKKPVLTITGAKTYPTSGELMMTTVSVSGGPGDMVTPAEVLLAWFDPSRSVMPREMLFSPKESKQDNDLANFVQMSSSQQESVAAALTELGIDYTEDVRVGGVREGAPAEGTLRPGDVVLAIRGKTANDITGFQSLAAQTIPGQKIPMRIRRDGKEMDVQVPTENVDGKAKMGIALAVGYDFPFDVKISIGNVGGPSAGMMFALSVYDELTPGPLAGKRAIAGTGTITAEGKVGPIGGIRQKMVGARDQGADYFLAPAANCDEVVGYEPTGLQVVKVATLEDSIHATEQIARTGTTDNLPTCEEK